MSKPWASHFQFMHKSWASDEQVLKLLIHEQVIFKRWISNEQVMKKSKRSHELLNHEQAKCKSWTSHKNMSKSCKFSPPAEWLKIGFPDYGHIVAGIFMSYSIATVDRTSDGSYR